MLGVQTMGPVMTREVLLRDPVEDHTPESHGGPLARNAVRAADGARFGRSGTRRMGRASVRAGDRTRHVRCPARIVRVGPACAGGGVRGGGAGPADRGRGGRIGNERTGRPRIPGAAPVDTGERLRGPSLCPNLARRICDGAGEGARILERVKTLGLSVVTLEEPEYPERLRHVDMPPPLLFVRGSTASLQATKAVAVVGTRWPTDKGRLIAGWIGSALVRAGAVVVSGLAVGIDGAAHAAVVGEGSRTVAVLGGGHARLFPRAHERLADAIVAAGGAVVSELQPDTIPTRGTFPRRNRLVSGLSDAVVVVEAGRRSGALITAGWALEQGRECFIVPGPLDSPTSAGCNAFLRTFPGQARTVCGVAELIEDLELGQAPVGDQDSGAEDMPDATRRGRPEAGSAAPRAGAVLATLSPVERVVAEILTEGPATADDLARRTSLAVATILSALTLLELRGLISVAGGRYVAVGPAAELGRQVGGGGRPAVATRLMSIGWACSLRGRICRIFGGGVTLRPGKPPGHRSRPPQETAVCGR